jgi:hypothetical protein
MPKRSSPSSCFEDVRCSGGWSVDWTGATAGASVTGVTEVREVLTVVSVVDDWVALDRATSRVVGVVEAVLPDDDDVVAVRAAVVAVRATDVVGVDAGAWVGAGAGATVVDGGGFFPSFGGLSGLAPAGIVAHRRATMARAKISALRRRSVPATAQSRSASWYSGS